MDLKSYLLLGELLKKRPATDRENRAFGLEHPLEQNNQIKQLSLWKQKHIAALKKPSEDDLFFSYLYTATMVLGVLVFIIGLFSGIGLLSYSGREPVNIVYFLTMVVFVPLCTMVLTILSMIQAHKPQNLLVHISPAFWMEKIFERLSSGKHPAMQNFKLDPRVGNWLVIERSQLFAWLFSWGLVVALLGTVVAKDIAFAWSTTLKVSPEEFHAFINMIAFAWRDWFPAAVPSLEVVEQSRYFRLGEKIDAGMIRHASILGEWWKFLLCTGLFYAIVLRFGMYLLAKIGLKRALEKSILNQKETMQLLHEMNDPLIVSSANEAHVSLEKSIHGYLRETTKLNTSYHVVLGWSYSKEEIAVVCDMAAIKTPLMLPVGGNNSLEEDSHAISRCKQEVLVCIKSWEPPTMDFVDFMQALEGQADKITVLPLGIPQDSYLPRPKALKVWAKKLASINNDKVWLKV